MSIHNRKIKKSANRLILLLLILTFISLSCKSTEQKSHSNICIDCPWIEQQPKLKLFAVGDMMFARGVARHIDTTNYYRPLSSVIHSLESADILTGNLESPISNIGAAIDKKYVFRADTEMIAVLEDAGFDVLNIANNHAFDYGLSCFCDCLDRFEHSNIKLVGGGRNLAESLEPKFINVKGIRLGFLGFNDTRTNYIGKNKPSCAPAHDPFVFEAISKTKMNCDILIVNIHWGEEYFLYPTERQIALGHALVDSGVDVVLGHHSHSWQAVEFYGDRLIAYSLGNFVFDQRDLMNNLTGILEIEFEGNKIEHVKISPVELLTTPKQPRPATSPYKNIYFGYLQECQLKFSTEVNWANETENKIDVKPR
ncbi:CapA family protein [bacterium]|nr:CapA family protein [bacterium]